jgi:DNA-binding beta-propeller fold protein YncE
VPLAFGGGNGKATTGDIAALAGGGGVEIGDILYTARDPGSGYLPCNGSVYLRASYPDLQGLLPPLGFDFANGVATGQSFSVAAQVRFIVGVAFSSDGTTLVVLNNSDALFQYSLATPFDLSTASYASKTLNPELAPASLSDPQDFCFSPDGTKLFVQGRFAVRRWDLATPFDISTASLVAGSLSITSQTGTKTGIAISPDGTRLYICCANSDPIYEYALSTPFDLGSGSYTGRSLAFNGTATNLNSMAVHPDGDRVFVLSDVTDKVHQINLSTPWDISTGTDSGISLSVTSSPSGMGISADGLRLYTGDFSSDSITEYLIARDALAEFRVPSIPPLDRVSAYIKAA